MKERTNKTGVKGFMWGLKTIWKCSKCGEIVEQKSDTCHNCKSIIDWDKKEYEKERIHRDYYFPQNDGKIYSRKKKKGIKGFEHKCINCIYYFTCTYYESYWTADTYVSESTCGYKQDREPFKEEEMNNCEYFKLPLLQKIRKFIYSFFNREKRG